MFADRLTLVEHCPACGFRFEREPGYWIGAMVINYGFVAGMGVLLFALANGLWSWPALAQVGVWSVFAVVGIVWFFPYSRLLWVLVDFAFLRPPGATDFPPEPPAEAADPPVPPVTTPRRLAPSREPRSRPPRGAPPCA